MTARTHRTTQAVPTTQSSKAMPHRRLPLLALTLALCAALVPTSWAGPGHDHGDAPPAATGDGPRRLADGSVFLPKPSQRQMGVRTLPVELAPLARTTTLPGRVVMDPAAGGKVQALLAGRLQPGPKGLPQLGQTVQRGEVLAYVEPATSTLERAGQQAQLAELRASQALAAKRLARLHELADTVPRKDIEAAESEVASLQARISAVGGGLQARDALVAPVSGVIASANAVAGQVVDARELVFEVVNPQRLQIEALAYDPALADDVAGAAIAVGGHSVPLRFVGAARSLREQALPLLLAPAAPEPATAKAGTAPAGLAGVAVGQTLEVHVQHRTRLQGLRVPSTALAKNPANETIVWVKTAAEQFAPRVVTTAPLDGSAVAITAGLAAGDRVAVQGANLINQVR
ncbi:MAG: HlyD family efflux transporter periplasmic adaptor subunit [Acidovorax sp.]|uniref:efflux RND transporter periplasmic adaptor subunit n=1 Tax=Acidovorax sp. TaxID=1872122 RepID=UPI00262046B1|nr:HlyD family efflux transporter periplasmic adaptor subunit [Acidovorax sp.]MDH4463484.1 HlyD family efflux transporter periplasmic adaptor subunit [Acidovorax sp.]